jgi:pimeloyl-ACP methyl ester carboxylesterase
MPSNVRAVIVLAAIGLAACGGGGPNVNSAATTTTTEATTTTTTGDTTTTTGSAPSATIDWTGCGGPFECAMLTVPLDYAHPDGPTVDLALIRRPAKDPSNRIGALLTDPGGPGGSGVDFVRGGFQLEGSAADSFDVVGWDPRGVGKSTAITCGATVPAFQQVDSGPDDAQEQAQLDETAKAVADECGQKDGALLAHVDTDDVVKDMDRIRIALGEDQLTYFGFSYGTLLGERYAQAFPDKVRAIVLDGVVDPSQDFVAFLKGQTVAIDAAMTRIFDACGAGCPLTDAAATYDRVAAAVETNPLPTSGGRPLGPSELATGAIFVSYDPTSWDFFYQALDQADHGDGSGMFTLDQAYESFGSFTQYAAVECVDSPHPEGSAEFAAFAAEMKAISPRFGPAVANELLPCAFWPVPVVGHPADVAAPGAPPILVIGNTGDAATPYEQAVKVAQKLEKGVLLTYNGEGHTSYGKSDCVNQAVDDYLINLTTPPANTTCK